MFFKEIPEPDFSTPESSKQTIRNLTAGCNALGKDLSKVAEAVKLMNQNLAEGLQVIGYEIAETAPTEEQG